MSTRSNIILRQPGSIETIDGKNIWQYYHHCDGYPEGVGLDLVTMAFNAFKSVCHGAFSRDGRKDLFYEFTSIFCQYYRDIPDSKGDYEPEGNYGYADINHLHGDIDFLYLLDFDTQNSLDIYCMPIPFGFFDYDGEGSSSAYGKIINTIVVSVINEQRKSEKAIRIASFHYPN